jgi:hypothetical protein
MGGFRLAGETGLPNCRQVAIDSPSPAWGNLTTMTTLSQSEFAQQEGVGSVRSVNFEAGGHVPRRATLDVVRRALETAGVNS